MDAWIGYAISGACIGGSAIVVALVQRRARWEAEREPAAPDALVRHQQLERLIGEVREQVALAVDRLGAVEARQIRELRLLERAALDAPDHERDPPDRGSGPRSTG